METGTELAIRRSAAFYFDSNNALLAILKNSANPTDIQATTGLIWDRARELNITPMSGRVPSKRNIADLSTRRASIKYKSIKRDEFRMETDQNQIAEHAIDRITEAFRSIRIRR